MSDWTWIIWIMPPIGAAILIYLLWRLERFGK